MLYSGSGSVDATLDSASGAVPDIEASDEYDVVHRVWRVSDPAIIASVQEQMQDRKLIIADGHHRYETALTYRDECDQREGKRAADAPHSWVMMTFVDM